MGTSSAEVHSANQSAVARAAAGSKRPEEAISAPWMETTPARVRTPTPVHVTAAWVNAFSPAKEAAVAFVGEYLAVPATADQIAVSLGLAPVNIGFDADPNLTPFVESARTGDAVPTIFQTDFAWEELADAFDDIRRQGDDVAGSLQSTATAIRKAPAPPEPEAAEGA